LNWLDFLIFFLIIAGMAIGYAQGLLRQVIGLAALYIGAVLGAQYFSVIGDWIRMFSFQSASSSRFLNAFSFFVILILVSSIINWLAYDAYRSTKLRIFPLVDQLGGTVVGLATAMIALSLVLPVLAFATNEPWPWSESTRLFVIGGLQSSRLIVIFDEFKPLLLNALAPWLPAGLPALFSLYR
ncbi:MAG: CvpA family protein, partial [Chloroflexota bacterium]|nr:CvpA family protein [Chloroflexota bacterium]